MIGHKAIVASVLITLVSITFVSPAHAYDGTDITGLLRESGRLARLAASLQEPGIELEASWNYGPSTAVAVRNDTAYTNCGQYFEIFDCTDETAPVPIGERRMTNPLNMLAIKGNYAYATLGLGGLLILDVSDASSPDSVACYAGGPFNYIDRVAVNGDYAYVTLYTLEETYVGRYLVSIDISDPANPVPLDSLAGFDDPHCGIAFVAGYAYLPDAGLLKVVDISNPAGMAHMAPNSIVLDENTNGITIDGRYCYLADEVGLVVVDCLNPAVPVLASSCASTWGHEPEAIAVSGDYAFVAAGYGVHYYHIDDPENCDYGDLAMIPIQSLDIAVEGNYAFIAGGDDGLCIVYVEIPTGMALEGRYDMPGEIRSVRGEGAYIYAANGRDGMRIFNAAPDTVGSLSLGGSSVEEVAVSGVNAYLGSWSGFCAVDISDPYDPHTVGSCYQLLAYGSSPHDILLRGDTAYVAWGDAGIRVLDISNPANIFEIGSIDTYGDAEGVVIAGQYAYVADGEQGLVVIDVSDPTDPGFVASCAWEGSAEHVAVRGQHAYLADDDGGFVVIDISDPSDPDSVNDYQSYLEAEGIAVSGDTLYLADMFGLKMFSLLDPGDPQLICYYQTGDQAMDINVSEDGTTIYVACERGGFYVFGNRCVAVLVQSYSASLIEDAVEIEWTLSERIASRDLLALRRDHPNDPFRLLENASIERNGLSYRFRDAEYVPGTVCTYRIVRNEGGKWSSVLFEVEMNSAAPPMPVTLYHNYPNPFNPATRIRYYLPERTRVRLAVYDVSGRRVALLADGQRDAGYHNEMWTGLDEAGCQAVSGVYFYRLLAGKTRLSGKMVLVR